MKNQELKTNPMAVLLASSLKDLPTPASISTWWNVGFMLGMTLALQLVTGIMLSMSYVPEMNYAFNSVISITRDISNGWLTRTIHMNGATLFFILIYLHTMRGIYFFSPSNRPKVWLTGVSILLMTMATAFLGYVLPWSQMSFWGATVITGVVSAIPLVGSDLTIWLWGGPSVSQPTLNRFFSLHFLLPMIITVLVLMHLILLHETGSSNPTSFQTNTDKIKFMPTFFIKDTLPILVIYTLMMMLTLNYPFIFGDPETFLQANPMIAPLHIQPEWYFLFAYVILRSVPSKLGGVAALGASVLIIMPLTLTKSMTMKFSLHKKMIFWNIVSTLVVLTWIGGKAVEYPFEGIGQLFTMIFFTLTMML